MASASEHVCVQALPHTSTGAEEANGTMPVTRQQREMICQARERPRLDDCIWGKYTSITKALIRARTKEADTQTQFSRVVNLWDRERRVQPAARDKDQHAVCRTLGSVAHVRRARGCVENRGFSSRGVSSVLPREHLRHARYVHDEVTLAGTV